MVKFPGWYQIGVPVPPHIHDVWITILFFFWSPWKQFGERTISYIYIPYGNYLQSLPIPILVFVGQRFLQLTEKEPLVFTLLEKHGKSIYSFKNPSEPLRLNYQLKYDRPLHCLHKCYFVHIEQYIYRYMYPGLSFQRVIYMYTGTCCTVIYLRMVKFRTCNIDAYGYMNHHVSRVKFRTCRKLLNKVHLYVAHFQFLFATKFKLQWFSLFSILTMLKA